MTRLLAFFRRQSRLAAVVHERARERVHLRLRLAAMAGEVAALRARVRGQHAEAARMAQELANTQDELDAALRQLGRQSMSITE